MRVARSVRHRIEGAGRPILLCLVVLAWAHAFSSPTTAARLQEALAGTYEGHARGEDPAKRSFSLTLSPDGAALLTTLYIGRHPAAESGRWSRKGAEIVLTFDPLGSNQPPRPITFHYHRKALHPIHWDLSEWGRTGPPVLYKQAPGGKVTGGRL